MKHPADTNNQIFSRSFLRCTVLLAILVIASLAVAPPVVAFSTPGEIVAWGYNVNDQCMRPFGYDYVAVSAGGSHSLAIKKTFSGNVTVSVPDGHGCAAPAYQQVPQDISLPISLIHDPGYEVASITDNGAWISPTNLVWIGSVTSDHTIVVTFAPEIQSQVPIAAFTAVPPDGNAPLTVAFNDTSTGGTPSAWNWSFGDGVWFNTTDITQRNATHTYSTPNTYVANLTVSNPGGSNTTIPGKTIIVNLPPPIASFTPNTTSGYAPLTVSFTDTSTGGAATAWNWSFGDGTWFNTTQSTERNPTHTYAGTGQFTVTLMVSNAGGTSTTQPGTVITVGSVTGISPSSGRENSIVTGAIVSGSGFTSQTTFALVKGGTSIQATNIHVIGTSSIQGDLDLTGATTGSWDVQVSNQDGHTGTGTGLFTVSSSLPVISSISPSSYPRRNVRVTMTINGSGFQSAPTAQLQRTGYSPIPVQTYTSRTSNQIVCIFQILNAATGAWDVNVTNNDGGSTVKPGGFTIT